MSVHRENLTSYLAAFIAELVYSGVKDVVISPGSRSTPMALIMAEHPELNLHVHVDERSAAFFALGIAKAKRKPVAILCTSGTAAANYYPAIIEAKISRVPLIVLTADRPHELRDVGAPQSIDQIHLYGNNVKWFVEMAPPESSDEIIRYARTVCARAAATAIGYPAGPVHLNFPFREPLIPLINEELFNLPERTTGFVKIKEGRLTLDFEEFSEIANTILSIEEGIIVCGPMDVEGFAEEVVAFSKAIGYPILADPLSQLRSMGSSHNSIIDCYDTFLRNADAKNLLKPKVIIRFGAMPVSKALSIFLKENRHAIQIVVDGGGGWRDPGSVSTDMLYCDEILFCEGIIQRVKKQKDSAFLSEWKSVNDLTRLNLATIQEEANLSEGKLFYQLAEIVPNGATLFVGNSMPIRDLDTFYYHNEKKIRIMANRGANGIDGIISTALGAAAVNHPLYLVVGDLTFYHDLNGLLASKLYNIDINIIVINNNGGGIFSFLPQSSEPKNFELLFGTPLDLKFEHVVHMYGGSYELISSWGHLEETLIKNSETHGLKVLEIPTIRDNNLKEHRKLWNFVSQEITKSIQGEN